MGRRIIANTDFFCDNHAMEEKNSRANGGVILAIAVIIAFTAGFYSGKSKNQDVSPSPALSNATSGAPSDVDFSPFWKAWSILDDNFVAATTTASSTQARVWGAIQGMTGALGDPYTVFFPPTPDPRRSRSCSPRRSRTQRSGPAIPLRRPPSWWT